MNIVFMGSPSFAVPTLQKLIESEHNIVGVYSQPPRPAGRGQKLAKTPVHTLAEEHGLTVHTPTKLKEADFDVLKQLKPDLICVVAYGLILPKAVLDIAPCVNLHPSALPKWRGAAPMNYPILKGETTTDICIMQMEEGLDSGPVYLRKSYNIGVNETAGELHDRFKTEGAKLMLEVVNNWENYKNQAVPQEGESTYAHKFKTKDLPQIRALNFNQSAAQLHNQIKGLSPWPSATFKHQGEEIKVLKSTLSPLTKGNAGEVVTVDAQGVHVGTGSGVICLTVLQRAGKKAMNANDFIKGYLLEVGSCLL